MARTATLDLRMIRDALDAENVGHRVDGEGDIVIPGPDRTIDLYIYGQPLNQQTLSMETAINWLFKPQVERELARFGNDWNRREPFPRMLVVPRHAEGGFTVTLNQVVPVRGPVTQAFVAGSIRTHCIASFRCQIALRDAFQ
jgi:hypothetical protein